MKKTAILLLLSVIAFSAVAQSGRENSNSNNSVNWHKTGLFLDLNAGARYLGETSAIAEMSAGQSFNAGLGYYFNDIIGVKGRLDYNQFKATYNGVIDRSFSVGASAEVMLRLIQLLGEKKSRKFSLNFHAGAGLTTLRNPSFIDFRKENGIADSEKFITNQDDIGHIILGLTPQFHLNQKWSINLDVSHFTQFSQGVTYDTDNLISSKNVTGIISTTVGLTFRP
ncbi:outer membrane beta-barrel protein [Brumimicrobium mesophilum]|uniref:outer membrane beta-barrel protein n=1 Tax=Brumimicrobium mesophilum TaxID=392717 RepID=UPI000D142E9A|nr:outer membrane beta-barrel protein [Brumimicrobium mesophilum]